MAEAGERLEFPDADPTRDYSDEDKERLTRNLEELHSDIDAGNLVGAPLTPGVVAGFHRRIFAGVRDDFAGRMRSADWGSQHVVFGPHRSHHRSDVPSAVAEVCKQTRRSVRSLYENADDPSYEASAFHTAVWIQAQLIRIHPFEDGNGRTSRAITSHILVALGLDPVPVEACRQEYIGLLNDHYLGGPLQPLVDLYIRLATD